MIIRQTTTIVFEYPQDYLQEQEWCKTKEDRWIHKGRDTLGAVYENQILYSIGATADRKTEHRDCINCESAGDCAKCRGFEDEPQTERQYDHVWDMYVDEFEDEPQTEPLHTCSVNGRPYDCGNCEYHKCTVDEPQTEREGE